MRSFEGAGLTMESVIRWLSNMTNRTVIDQAGMADRYDIRVQWVPQTRDPRQAAASIGDAAQVLPTDVSSPTVYAALEEQLGLRLESGRAPIEVIVIESVDRPTPD